MFHKILFLSPISTNIAKEIIFHKNIIYYFNISRILLHFDQRWSLSTTNVCPESVNIQFLPQSFRSSRLLHEWLCTRANVELRHYQRVIGDDGRVDMDRSSCSTLRDDNVARVTRWTVSSERRCVGPGQHHRELPGNDCRWCGLISEMKVYIADNDNRDHVGCQTLDNNNRDRVGCQTLDNDNRDHVDCQTLDKVGKLVKEDRCGRL